MAEISPVQTDAAGITTFIKVEQVQVNEPVPQSELPKSGKSCCEASDSLNFSRPMRKRMEEKKSYFKQPPAQAEQIRQQQAAAEQQALRKGFEIVG